MDATKLKSLPLELRRGNRFACWRTEQIRDKVWIKIPVDAHTGRDAACDDPATWSTWDEAVAFCQAHQNAVLGIGRWLVASDVPALMAIEFAECLDEQGRLIRDHVAAQWIGEFDTYTEVAPSGSGVTLWAYATHDLGGRTGRSSQEKSVAIYRERQFVPLTGLRLIKFSGVAEWCQPTLNGLYQAVFGAEDARNSKPVPPPWRQRSSFTTVLPPARTATTINTHALPRAPTPLKIDAAKDFLTTTLRSGAVEQARIIAAAMDKGISEKTLRRAKRVLRVRSTRRTYQGTVLWEYRR
jgi:hypothetical protein